MIPNFKKILFTVFVMTFAFSLTSCNNDNNKNSGYDGRVFDISTAQDESVTASITKVGINYEIVISGEGEVLTYNKKELVPWNAISKKISSVTIEDGIENIGDYYFYSATLSTYYIPSSVIKIEENSFNASATIYSHSTNSITANCKNKIYYYSEDKPSEDGKYWHMIGETPIVWDHYKIMFVGNSFTYFPSDLYSASNPGVCAITKEIGDNLKIDLEVDFVVKGAHTLKKFADKNDEMGSILDEKLKNSSDYDYIILQEQSTTPVNDYNSFNSAVSSIINKVNETQNNCQVYLYSTWGFPSGVSTGSVFSSVSEMEKLIRDAYIKCADENDVKVSNVGEAFSYVYDNHSEINLYWSDEKHQSYAGAYLSACVHLTTIFNIDIRESSFVGILDEDTANTLQDVAYNIVLK